MSWKPCTDGWMKSRTLRPRIVFGVTLGVLGIWISGCKPAVEMTPVLSATAQESTTVPTAFGSPTTTPKSTLTATQSPPTVTLVPGHVYISPLDGVSIEKLPEMVSNKFSPPRLGSDDPHQGVDFAVVDQASGIALCGNPVQAILGGTIAGVIEDRFPYGNAILVESQMEALSPVFLDSIILPTPGPIALRHPVLTCPDIDFPIYIETTEQDIETERSLYLMYAHLKETPDFQLGDPISPHQVLGTIGDSGNALNPHLHVELRVGPSGFQFPGMAHYDASASQKELAYYCLWRISGAFQVIDPMVLFLNE